MFKLPFYIGNFIACFVPGHERRHRVRGWVNVIFFYIPIVCFIRRVYKEPVKKIKFIRQVTLNRTACVVNDKYFVKIFRNVSAKRVKDYAFLLDYIRPKLNISIPKIYVAKHIPMYVCEKLPGRNIYTFNRTDVIAHEEKIIAQVFDIIKQIQNIPFDSIEDNKRFEYSMQKRATEKPCDKQVRVLAHFDLNATNLLFDNDYNIISVIDWDSLSMAKNPDTDKNVFFKFWEQYKKSKR